jgi:hypothetical protein
MQNAQNMFPLLSNFNAMEEHPHLGLWTYIKTTVSIKQLQNQVARERAPIITQAAFWIRLLVLWGGNRKENWNELQIIMQLSLEIRKDIVSFRF